MITMKFGGTSVASLENIQRIKSIIQNADEPCLVVVSAISGVTDRLHAISDSAIDNEHHEKIDELQLMHYKLIDELFATEKSNEVKKHLDEHVDQLRDICHSVHILQERSDKILARIQSFGELMSSFMLCQYINTQGIDISWIDSRKMIKAGGSYLRAEVGMRTTVNQMQAIDKSKNYIAGGFIASNEKGETTLLGRGGSDYSAALYAVGVKASRLEIWSDVSGMQNANPRIVKEAGPIAEMSYKEAFEMAFFGAKVLYPPTIKPVMENDIPLYLKNTFHPEEKGTYINKSGGEEGDIIKGVSSLPEVSIINITGVGLAKEKGSARRVFYALEQADVNVILITQSCSEQSICLGINLNESHRAVDALSQEFSKEIERGLLNPIEIADDCSIIAVVGDKMKDTVGLSGKVFSALGKNGINIIAIAQGASERNISLVVNKRDEKKSINVIHEKFFQKATKKIHLFIAGIGNVGEQFLNVVKEQKELLINEHNIQLNIMAIVNSSKYLYDENGLNDFEMNTLIQGGTPYGPFEEIVSLMKEANLQNCIFVDNTASAKVSEHYASILQESISIVTCNKIACSASSEVYNKLQQLAHDKNCSFRYETTVGAALPIIKTIQDIRLSGDKVKQIQAVLSGSLNFIFNYYDTSKPFAEIVRQAKDEGYTEPDPLVDLSGLDVKRKLLILAREAGYQCELDQISFDGFLPQSVIDAPNTEAMFEEMLKQEDHFANLYRNAADKNCRLKVVAEMKDDSLRVQLKEIPSESPLYNLAGKDNIIAMHTQRYADEPLIIKGAGAGAEITASGVFSDVMKIINL